MSATRVLFVCLGNICRSSMAEGVFLGHLQARGLRDRFEVDSAGTGSWHIGEKPDRHTLAVLRCHGIHLDTRARQVRSEDGERFDWILAMDHSNERDVKRVLPAPYHPKVHPVLSIAGGGDVPDPYYGGPEGFDRVYEILEPVLGAWLDRMIEHGG